MSAVTIGALYKRDVAIKNLTAVKGAGFCCLAFGYAKYKLNTTMKYRY